MKISVIGCAGRMGRFVCESLLEKEHFSLVGGLVRSQSPLEGEDLGKLCHQTPCRILATSKIAKALEGCDGIIDFSTTEASLEVLSFVKKNRMKNPPCYLLSTTGFTNEQERTIRQFGHYFPLIHAKNTSLGITIMTHVAEKISSLLDNSWDVDIIETHHKQKKDKPSGTAKHLLQAIGRGRARDVAIHSLRAGTNIGEHTILWGGRGERITLTHTSEGRALFAQGALKAVEFLHHKPPALYTMEDVLACKDLCPN